MKQNITADLTQIRVPSIPISSRCLCEAPRINGNFDSDEKQSFVAVCNEQMRKIPSPIGKLLLTEKHYCIIK